MIDYQHHVLRRLDVFQRHIHSDLAHALDIRILNADGDVRLTAANGRNQTVFVHGGDVLVVALPHERQPLGSLGDGIGFRVLFIGAIADFQLGGFTLFKLHIRRQADGRDVHVAARGKAHQSDGGDGQHQKLFHLRHSKFPPKNAMRHFAVSDIISCLIPVCKNLFSLFL